ncbi:type II secretion system F family protein [Leekyejoonella antrihumi]|uniref:Type II secretion system protein GspF domain-containing protein n=1 Tax=Leekyejoonella antrihumi TaxID=1660198 RepID=A0A563DWJ5_9MICO|nr:type II secretion system F family protein [Leekyejoonella antrihumi]TWP34312.1 hypothetical protein FGL98_17925 [Leekyejoonella antrihumi]
MAWCVAALLVSAVLLWPRRPMALVGEVHRSVTVPPGSTAQVRRGRRRLRGRRQSESEVRDGILGMLESVGPAVAAGVVPAVAVATAAELLRGSLPAGPLRADVGQLAAVARRGDELGAVWATIARRHRIEALHVVAQAWALCEELGCGLSESLETATALMRDEVDRQRRIRVATAGPRATMQLLTLLPVAGVGLCAMVGVDPIQLYSGRALTFTLLPGCVLLLAGRALARWMIGRACSPTGLT